MPRYCCVDEAELPTCRRAPGPVVPIYSGADSAYVPCISKVDLGNGQVAVYDNDGNLVYIESK